MVTADPCDRYVNQLMFLAGCGGGPFTAEFVESFCDRGFCKEQGVRIPFEQRRNAIQVGVVEAIATEYGIDPEILRKTLRGERLSPEEIAAVTQAGSYFAPYEEPA